MRVLVTGGGTGGHIYPALAIIKGLKSKYPDTQFLYIGTPNGMEANIVPKAGIEFRAVSVAGLQRRLSLKNVGTVFKALTGYWEARSIIKKFLPHVVIGTGGYVCGPVVLAAAMMKIPTLIHEQNAYPGITNKLLSRFVKMVCVTFSDSTPYFPSKARIQLTGLPVRPEINMAERETGYQKLGLDPDKFTLLVFGGSRGARSINQSMVEVIRAFAGAENIQILHITGELTYNETLDRLAEEGIQLDKTGNIKIMPYLYNMEDAMAVADLIICRAGAATIAELTAKGIPAILVPYPYAAENHQEYNARALEKREAAILIRDQDLKGEELKDLLITLLKDRKGLSKMATNCRQMGIPNALDNILQYVIEIKDGDKK